MSVSERPIFYFDLRSPTCWLVAERLGEAFEQMPEWVPVDAAALGQDLGDVDRERVERLAAEWDLLAVHWPELTPPATDAQVLAYFAKSIGRTVALAQAAFRQAYNAGRDIGDSNSLLLAAAACELHPRAVLKALETRSNIEGLRNATEAARVAGVIEVPAVIDDGRLTAGEDLLSLVASALVEPD